jgi:hypothetical protein
VISSIGPSRTQPSRCPVVFNLSSWARRRPPLADWLVDELQDRYDVPRRLAKEWVDAGEILPLLDGLDEVAASARAECVAAINGFLDDYFGGLLVCSRTEDYDALPIRLRLREAVELHPPTREQIRDYLDTVGAPLADVKRALGVDDGDGLWELLESPLMLDLVARTYEGLPADSLRVTGGPRERRAQLFTTYIELMFERRPIITRYQKRQALRWLAWLARSMRDHDQTEFHLDRLQPDWLPPTQQQRTTLIASIATILALGLGGGLLVGLGAGLIAQRVLGLTDAPVIGLISGLAGGLVAAPLALAGVTSGRIYGPLVWHEKVWWSWSGLAAGLAFALAIGFTGLNVGTPFAVFGGIFVAQLAARLSSERINHQLIPKNRQGAQRSSGGAKSFPGRGRRWGSRVASDWSSSGWPSG